MVSVVQTRRSHGAGDGKTLLAQSSVVSVEACACGVLHLHFGPVSLRFTEDALEELQRTIAEAVVQMGGSTACEVEPPLFSTRKLARGSA